MNKIYPCNFCQYGFPHYYLWQSIREEHIKERSTDSPETTHKYKYCCAECEAKFRIEEEEDLSVKAWWQTPEGWETLVANVKAEMAQSKRRKHKHRGQVFAEALAEVNAEEFESREKKARLFSVFHGKLAQKS